MKTYMAMLLALACALLGGAASAQEMVSVAELHDQAEAMDGRWQETFETKNGEVAIDVPVIVPDVENMPVLTLERAKISRDLFEQIIQGKKGAKAKTNEFEYELEMDGKTVEFFLGREENGLTGYEAADTLWIQRGAYRFSQGTGLLDRAEPKTFHYGPWELDTGEAYLRGRTLTIEAAIDLMMKDITAHFPGDTFEIQPTKMVLFGSSLSEATGKAKEYRRNGYSRISFEQVIDGVPLIGEISSGYGQRYTATPESNKEWDKLRDLFAVGTHAVLGNTLMGYFASEEDYRTLINLARKRTVEIKDVPLASLDSVLEALGTMVEKGNIGQLHSVRLGYILYSNPDMTDYAFAIPRWVVEYVTPEDMKRDKGKDPLGFEEEPWIYNQKVLIDAQSAEPILFTIGDETIFSVPELKTWDDL